MRKSQPIKTKNTSFMIDRLASDLPPHQYVRELVQNSIEANATEILLDAHWPSIGVRTSQGLGPVWKLAIIDNGQGMTAEQLMDNIGQLSATGKIQGLRDNYGIGAKIAAMSRSPKGLIYLSWVDGHGVMMKVSKDYHKNEYVIEQDEDGRYFAEVSDAVKPEIIDQHGTVVVLEGRTSGEDTFQPKGEKQGWLIDYLNNRYYEFPAGVTVRARAFNYSDRSRWPADPVAKIDGEGVSAARTVDGYRLHSDSLTEKKGRVRIPGALVHWRILADVTKRKGFANYPASTSVIWRNEIYHMVKMPGCIQTQYLFGISAGNSRITLLVEPDEDTVSADTTRTRLIVAGKEPNWQQWGRDFAVRMPDELKEFIDTEHAKAAKSDPKEIERRVRRIMKDTDIGRYKPVLNGKVLAAGVASGGGLFGDDNNEVEGEDDDNEAEGNGGNGGTASDLYMAFKKDDGKPAKQVDGGGIPLVRWVTVLDGTRSPGHMEDRAASFNPTANEVLANWDFRLFSGIAKLAAKEVGDHPSAHDAAIQITRDWFATILAESVVRAKSISDPAKYSQWTMDDANNLLSETALTATCMSVYLVHGQIIKDVRNESRKWAVAAITTEQDEAEEAP